MVDMKNNFWWFKEGDGKDRTHVLPTPTWIAVIRIVQLVLGLLVLILTAVSANMFGIAWSSLALTWFTFAWTILHIGWLAISILVVPLIYNYWGQLAVEILSVIFWLASWAALASDASAIGQYEQGLTGGLSSSSSGLGKNFDTGSATIKVSAALGAVEWVLFVVTLVFFVMALVSHQKQKAPAAGTVGLEAGVGAESKTATEMTPHPHQAPESSDGQDYHAPTDAQGRPL